MSRLRARAPLRIDFAGGWTDVPYFALEEGGAVVSAAISPYAEGFVARPDEHPGALTALRSDRSYVSYSLALPAGAGLGSSAAQTVLWVTLVRSGIQNVFERTDIAEMACSVGAALGILGGKQDEYASALGGFNYLTFGEAVEVERILLPPDRRDALRSRLVLAYSGQSRISADIHEHVWTAYRERQPGALSALRSLKRLAEDARRALLVGDVDVLADITNQSWRHQKALHPSVTNPELDGLVDLGLRSGAIAGRAVGAGGGGCILFVTIAGAATQLKAILKQRRVRIVDFAFDDHGVFMYRG